MKKTDQLKDPLRGKLHQHANLGQPLIYDALSYRWSEIDPQDTAYIDFDGTQFPIGPNLHDALVRSRREAFSRDLWVDQICINQSEDAHEEKLQQVNIMGDIYAKAQKVLIWLGAGDTSSDIAMELFPLLVSHVVQADKVSSIKPSRESASELIKHGGSLAITLSRFFTWLWFGPGLISQAADKAPSLQPPQEASWEFIKHRGSLAVILSSLLTRSWFERVWTLQEAGLAQYAEVWCGEKSFPFSHVTTFVEGCQTDKYGHWGRALSAIPTGGTVSADPESPESPVLAHIFLVLTLKDGAARSSAMIFNSVRHLNCSDHRDRIYSVQKFLPSELADQLMKRPNISLRELYHFVALSELQRGVKDFLCSAGLSQHRSTYDVDRHEAARPRLALASWVPDWTFIPRTHSYWVLNNECLRKRNAELFAAGGSQTADPHFSFSHNDRILHTDALLIGRITDCGAPFRLARVPEDREDMNAMLKYMEDVWADFQSFVAASQDLATKCSIRYGLHTVDEACRRSLLGRMILDGSTSPLTGVLIRPSDEAVNALFDEFETILSMQKNVQEETRWVTTRLQDRREWTNEVTSRLSNARAAIMNFTKVAHGFLGKYNAVKATAEACKGRRFFITETHYMGIAPDITEKEKDMICVIPGWCAPFVIRPCGEHYQLIGECYVDGLMDGEAMRGNSSLEPITMV